MTLPSSFFDELQARLPLSQVVGKKVVWDNKKSNSAKGDFWAPCPFHQEKTASFHVDDRKGFYYCFGCHAKGNAISFVKDSENVGFMEAVKILAQEAGLSLPDQDPRAQEKADRKTQLTEVMQQAVNWYRLQLQTAQASGARSYLTERGLSQETQDQWQIGYAPEGSGLSAHLKSKGIAPQLLLDAGLTAKSDRGGNDYERFRGRIIFPILDTRGRPIALGGRALSAQARAKYLNSPETHIFDKGHTLYNHSAAREAVGRGAALLVAEGYMDVIALAQAGFKGAVAPLGTAITEHQLRMLWRISPEPIIALDGDNAGLRAAMRLIDLALPQLTAGQSLRFAIMPSGLDPDDLIKAKGPSAMQKLVKTALPIIELLWSRETEGKIFDSPERKAALDAALSQKLNLIQDPNLKYHYESALKSIKWAFFNQHKKSYRARPKSSNFKRAETWHRNRAPVQSSKHSPLSSGAQDDTSLRIEIIFAILLTHPSVIATFEWELERLSCRTEPQALIREVLLSFHSTPDLFEKLNERLGYSALDFLKSRTNMSINPALHKETAIDVVKAACLEAFTKHNAVEYNQEEIQDALSNIHTSEDESLTWRISQSAEQLERSQRGRKEDNTQFETAKNGSRLIKTELHAFEMMVNKITETPSES